MPWNQSKPILKQVRSLSITSCCSETSSCHLSCWKDDEQIFKPLLSRIHDGVCVCIKFPVSISCKKEKEKGSKTTDLFVHNILSFWAFLEIERADALMHLFRWVEPQFMACGRRSMLNNLFLNSFTTASRTLKSERLLETAVALKYDK